MLFGAHMRPNHTLHRISMHTWHGSSAQLVASCILAESTACTLTAAFSCVGFLLSSELGGVYESCNLFLGLGRRERKSQVRRAVHAVNGGARQEGRPHLHWFKQRGGSLAALLIA